MRSILTVGELCAGYGGIGLALEDLAAAHPVWVSDIDKAANLVLRERFPWADQIGDMTTLDWHEVQPVDVLTGGTPCQDLSTAGRRRGMNPGTRSNLWVSMREAIAVLRPGVIIWENVGGALSADAASDLEQREGLLGVATTGPVLRALGRVVGDLSTLGYVGGWLCLRASDIGAPHQRLRVFVIAREQSGRGRRVWRSLREQADQWRSSRTGKGVERLLPTPTAIDGSGSGQHPDKRRAGGHQVDLKDWVHGLVLPTPAVNDIGGNKTIDWWDEWHVRQKRSTGEIAGHGKSLNIELQRLLPTPAATDGAGARATTLEDPDPRYGDTLTDALWKLDGPRESSRLLPTVVASDQHNTRQSTEPKAMFANDTLTDVAWKDEWQAYAPAIRRWEAITRPAPPPTEVGSNGQPRLNAAFSEWMMGLPSGWVTDLVPSSAGRRLCGNGVCPQQAAHAISQLLARLPDEEVNR
jgi:DNA (cytosine-5)-methyltransferase 1